MPQVNLLGRVLINYSGDVLVVEHICCFFGLRKELTGRIRGSICQWVFYAGKELVWSFVFMNLQLRVLVFTVKILLLRSLGSRIRIDYPVSEYALVGSLVVCLELPSVVSLIILAILGYWDRVKMILSACLECWIDWQVSASCTFSRPESPVLLFLFCNLLLFLVRIKA